MCKFCIFCYLKVNEICDYYVVEFLVLNLKSVIKFIYRYFCEKYNEEMIYYCILCEILICKDCVIKVLEYKGYCYKNIVEGVKEKRNKVKLMIQSMYEYFFCL